MWTEFKPNKFVEEISTIHADLRDDKVLCPKCETKVTYSDLMKNPRIEHEEIASWQITHSCGATLKLLND